MAGDAFQAHVERLRLVLQRRAAIVEGLQGLLNAQRKPSGYLRDRSLLSGDFEACVLAGAGLAQGPSRLQGQLEDAH